MREADIRHVPAESVAAALGVAADTLLPAARLALSPITAETPASSWLGPALIGAALFIFLVEAFLALAFSTYR